MKMLIEDIKNKQFKNIYLLTGEEIYLRNQYRKRLREALLDPEDTMNYASFEGKNINPKEVIDLAETMPFFADRRVIEISDSGFAKNACPELAEYIPEIPDSTCIILTESEVDKRGKFYKAVKNNGRVVEFARTGRADTCPLGSWYPETGGKADHRGDACTHFWEEPVRTWKILSGSWKNFSAIQWEEAHSGRKMWKRSAQSRRRIGSLR